MTDICLLYIGLLLEKGGHDKCGHFPAGAGLLRYRDGDQLDRPVDDHAELTVFRVCLYQPSPAFFRYPAALVQQIPEPVPTLRLWGSSHAHFVLLYCCGN